jgi:hypothetical protein
MMLSPALAEVWDKVVADHWRPQDGPAWMPDLATSVPIGFILVGGLAIVAVLKLRWLGYCATAILLLMMAVMLADIIQADDVYKAAASEGCRSLATDLLNIGMLGASALAYLWLGHRAKCARETSEAVIQSTARTAR